MSTPYITFQVPLIGNEDLIAEVSSLISGSATASSSAASEDKPTRSAPEAKTKGKGKAKAKDTGGSDLSIDDMKKLVRAAKAEHGEDFCKDCIGAVEGKTNVSLGRCLSSVKEDRYADLKALLEAGPEESDEEDDDGLGADEVSVEDVKKAVRAYSKEAGRDEAKALLKKYGCGSLTQVDDLDQDDLQALMDECV